MMEINIAVVMLRSSERILLTKWVNWRGTIVTKVNCFHKPSEKKNVLKYQHRSLIKCGSLELRIIIFFVVASLIFFFLNTMTIVCQNIGHVHSRLRSPKTMRQITLKWFDVRIFPASFLVDGKFFFSRRLLLVLLFWCKLTKHDFKKKHINFFLWQINLIHSIKGRKWSCLN